jgi:hypothetical protein|tara:strand:+ start:2207 stop:2485 length:279 start_codon:yes stop_codon:yes gene_type:complete
MKVKEILSYHLNEDFGIVYIDFILEDDESEKEINNLEIPEEELLEVCELYESKEWVDWETDDVVDIKGEINEEALYEGLEYYINNTENVLNL